jgi:hypothetical protein
MKELFGMNLSQILKSAVRESIDDIIGDEKVKQKKTADALKGFKAKKKSSSSPESADVDEAEEAEPSSDKSGLKDPVTPKETALPEITLDKVIDLVGSIRAGKSLKEKEVLSSLKDYFTRLNGNERVALYAFLTGIAKVMNNVEEEGSSGTEVATPDAAPYKIKMKKETPKQEDQKASAGEDSPIVVGEAASKINEYRLLRRLK